MELLNATPMAAGFTGGLRPDGRELLVVVVKGTFTIPALGQAPTLAAEQVPLIEADQFTGEPGLSAPLYESDYPPFKPRCDVLLNGSAYAPGGRPADRVTVALRVETMTKSFQVLGDRRWQRGLVGLSPSAPALFTVMPFSYDNAFGGIDGSDEKKLRYHPTNHAGMGYHHNLDLNAVVGQPVPNTEEPDNPVTNPRGNYRPMAFGAIGRAWQPRPTFAGTYDQNWLDNIFPFLPADFKDDYYQSAPPDQQVPHLSGGEEVTLLNLTPSGKTVFAVPKITIPIEFVLASGQNGDRSVRTQGTLDTLLIEPDLGRFNLLWRAHRVLKKNIFEVAQVVVGEMPRGWYRARESGKPFYRSLGELAVGREIE